MIRIAIIGAGAWGLNHVRAATTEAGCSLVAVADPDPAARASALSIAPTVRVAADPDELFADPSISAVVIASPAPTHVPLARAALEAGKHALVEKPLALGLAEARSLQEVALSTSRVAAVGHLMVHHPAVARMREMIVSGALGRLHYIHATRVNLGRARREESTLWSLGPHDLSMLDFLLGRSPLTVSARGLCVVHPGVEDVVFLAMRYPTGEMAHIHLSRVSPHKERRLTVVGEAKQVVLDDVANDKLKIYARGQDALPAFTEYAQYLAIRDGDVHIPEVAMQEPLRLQLRHFLTCIKERRRPLADLASGVRITAVLDAAQRSLALDGVPVEVAVN
ncbi:MAG TPA: Gfo/Idh/MocA family oxidoreductase [Kofleriaceae bacterium]|jgi:predicted dehydrogenase|nr:Gfo/Idh/MocA family oxidoreductase [Kofleriaceae bacterium]